MTDIGFFKINLSFQGVRVVVCRCFITVAVVLSNLKRSALERCSRCILNDALRSSTKLVSKLMSI